MVSLAQIAYGSGRMSLKGLTIVSGGQIGADRPALDWAIAHGIPHGGWCPKRRNAEDGPIAQRYELEHTDIGKVFLEIDVQLRKDTASATSPQTPEGKKYWDKLYAKAEELFGYDAVTIPTLTCPWIVPGEIIIRETFENVYIYKATLKVMLEEDYLKSRQSIARNPQYKFDDPRFKASNE
jgi:hypothetical protein